MSDLILNPEWEHAQFVSISELRECERKLEVLNRGNANAERILCEAAGVESGRDVLDWIVAAKDHIKRLEEAGDEAIYPLEYAARVRIWTEAKEAKL